MKKRSSNLPNSLKRIIKTSFIVLIGLILSKLIFYGYRIIIAKYYGPEAYGLFSLALMISGFFIALSSIGLIDGILRYVSLYRGKDEEDKINYLFKFSLKVLLVSSTISSILLFLLSNFISITIFHNPDLVIYLQIFSVTIFLSVLSNLFLAVIRAFEQVGLYSFIQNILSNFLKLILLILLVFIGFKSNAISVSYLLGTVGVLIVSYLVCKYSLPQIFLRKELSKSDQKKIVSRLFTYSWPIVFLAIAGSLLYWIDSFAIGYFHSAKEVGFYNAAVPIAALFDMALVIFIQLFFPLILKEYSKKNIKLIRELSKQVGKWVFMINFPFLLLVLFFPGVIINLLFGQEYLVAENALRLLSIGAFVYSISSISNNLLLMLGKSKLILTDIVIFALINLILNFILVPIYGMNGAAFATAICYSLLGIVFIIQSRNYISIVPLRRKMINITLSSLIPLALLFYLRSIIPINLYSMIFISGVFVLTYLIALIIGKGLDKNDLMILGSIKNKLLH